VAAERQTGNGHDAEAAEPLILRGLSALSPRARLDALVTSDGAGVQVRSLPAEQLYLDIAEVGLADATEVVQLASPEQFQSFVDLAAWKGDRMDAASLLTWLRAARGDDPEEFLAKLAGLDAELLELLLRTDTVIHDLEEEPDLHVEGLTLESADGRYRVEFRGESALEQTALRAVVADLMAADPLGLSRLLEAVRWELPSELEEVAYRFRSARLADLGFPDLDTARALYARVPLPPAPPGAPPAALAAVEGAGGLLGAALLRLTAEERSRLEDEVRSLVNAVLVDERADPGDLIAVRRAGERARDTLQLGLEAASGGDPLRAAEVLRTQSPRNIFQVGFTLGLRLQDGAERVARRPLARLDGNWLLWPDTAAVVAALRRPRPLRGLRVEGAEPVPFRRLREIDEAEVSLRRAEAQVVLFGALLGGTEGTARAALDGLEPDWPAGGTPAVLLSALGHAALGGALRVAPLQRSELRPLAEALLEGSPGAPRIRPPMRDRLAVLLSALAPDAAEEAKKLVDQALQLLLEQVGPALASGDLPGEASALLPFR
jgi:Family of unknown function (DUF6178)